MLTESLINLSQMKIKWDQKKLILKGTPHRKWDKKLTVSSKRIKSSKELGEEEFLEIKGIKTKLSELAEKQKISNHLR